jgi:regulator of nonsense transcripts 2
MLDSSIKRNTTLIKKLKVLNEESRAGVCDDVRKVNLSKYLTEAVAAIAEAKLKAADVHAAVQVCSLLHQRYDKFVGELVPAVQRTVKAADESASRKRSSLRLLTEMVVVGLTLDASALLTTVKELAHIDYKPKDKEAALGQLTLLVGFAKHAKEELLWAPPPPVAAPVPTAEEAAPTPAEAAAAAKAAAEEQQAAAEVEESAPHSELMCYTLPQEQQKPFRALLRGAYTTAVGLLPDEHAALIRREQANARYMETRGEVPEEAREASEKARKLYDLLTRNVQVCASVSWVLDHRAAHVDEVVGGF